jgi:alcohol dehydrogenase
MLLGAALGGMAIENSMLGAAHAAANPLTAQYNIIHGMAVGLMLPAVIRFNAQLPAARLAYEELAAVPEMALLTECQEDPVEALASHVEWLLNTAGMPRSLAAAGANPSGIPALALEAVKQWTAGFNPRPLTAHEFENLFAAAFKERS